MLDVSYGWPEHEHFQLQLLKGSQTELPALSARDDAVLLLLLVLVGLPHLVLPHLVLLLLILLLLLLLLV